MTDKWKKAVYSNKAFGALLTDLRSGVPQGSILGPLLFNIFLCELFLEHDDCCFTNYADDTKLVASNTAEVIENLTIITPKLFTWFTWLYSCRYQNHIFHSCRTCVVRVGLVSHSCRSCSTRVTFVSHLCCTRVVYISLVSLVSQLCHICVALVAIVSLVSGTRVVN